MRKWLIHKLGGLTIPEYNEAIEEMHDLRRQAEIHIYDSIRLAAERAMEKHDPRPCSPNEFRGD